MKRIVGSSLISERVCDQFLQAIGRYSKRKKHSITVYLDGGDLAYASHEHRYGLHITYSGYQQTADDMIMQSVKSCRGQAILVVTSDRELADFARNCGADILGSEEFYEYLKATGIAQARSSAQASLHKLVSDESDQSTCSSRQDLTLNELMELGSRQLPLKPESEPQSRKSSGQQLSKVERSVQRKLKKL